MRLVAMFSLMTLLGPVAETAPRRQVDIVICLDTSGSMDELLDSARARLWDVVHQLSRMSPTPELRIGLLTYGSPGVAAEEDGWVAMRSDLTDDLDRIYAQLMSLSTDGGDELVGRALDVAVNRMSWSFSPDALRLVFLAGNESADQGVERWDFRNATHRARVDDIIVNALYAGDREQGVREQWDEVAREGNGNFSSIDLEASLLQISAPQDEELMELNRSLNSTYVPYGSLGETGLQNQRAQDEGALRLGVQSCSSRIASKGTALYTNAGWDLVDRAGEEGFEWNQIPVDDLPEQLRTLGTDGLDAFIAGKRGERESLQQRIQELSEEREKFLRAEKERLLAGAGSLDDLMKEALLSQAREKGFTCADC